MQKILIPTLFALLAAAPAFAECKPKTVSLAHVVSQATVAVVDYGGSRWRLVQVTGRRRGEVFPAVYQEKGNRCVVAFADHGGDARSLSEGDIPRPVVISFARLSIMDTIKHKGKDAFLRDLTLRPSISPEEGAALQQLGVDIPNNVKVESWAK
jgi:hypothetical protein